MTVVAEAPYAAKQEASARYLRRPTDLPQFAALTISSIATLVPPTVNVHAVGLGPKLVEGRPDTVTAVRFYVLRKVPLWMLPPAERLPSDIGGIPTDIIESQPAYFAATPTPWQRQMSPVLAGASMSHPSVGAGTLGAICRTDPDDGKRFALSNNHVLANLGRAKIGDEIVQPSPLDATTQPRAVATLVKVAPLHTDGMPNRVDAALAEFLPGFAPATSQVIGLGGTGSPVAGAVGMRVVKSGRTTNITRGVVTDATYDVNLPLHSLGIQGSALFEDVLRIEGGGAVVGNPGDSGALFLTDDEVRCPVGLLFATGAAGGYALACDIIPVLKDMGVVIA